MASRREVNEGVLRTAEGSIRYVTAGRGPSVLLLRAGPPVGLADPLLRWLAGSHRVFSTVVPEPTEVQPPDPGGQELEPMGRWLLALVEGLGLDRPDVFTEPSLGPNLARIAERLDGVVGSILSAQVELSPVSSSDLGR